MKKPIIIAAILGLAACAQILAFEQRAAPVIAQACAAFHSAEADPLVQIALAAGGIATGAGPVVSLVKSYGDAFCANGPPAGDTTTPDQQASWLSGIIGQMLAAAKL